MVTKYGLWDQIRVDHGKEWQLILFIQASIRYNTQRAPHLQTTSKLVSNNEFVILFVLYMLHKIRDSFIILVQVI